ncbi:hypothetical protein ACH5BK_09930 [Arcobacter sp. YIC-80]
MKKIKYKQKTITSTYLRVSNMQSVNSYNSQFMARENQEVILLGL